MCGRFARWQGIESIEEFDDIRIPPSPFWFSTYNAAPRSVQPIVRLSEETGEPEVVPALWSIVPTGTKDPKDLKLSTFNARSEEIHQKRMFREAVEKNRRCLIPASIFYEWKKLSATVKKPYAIGMKTGKPFAFAGLWHPWTSHDGSVVPTFTIATSAPNDLMEPIHDRMPCILGPDEYARWLKPSNPEESPWDLLRPYPSEKMQCWEVGKEIGNVRNDHPGLVNEYVQETLFDEVPYRD